jgi:hypothetical protein
MSQYVNLHGTRDKRHDTNFVTTGYVPLEWGGFSGSGAGFVSLILACALKVWEKL